MIAGDGPERDVLARMHDPRVTFVGEVDAATRDRLLRTATALVIPSRVLANGRTEGTPVVALEALAANVPVIASAVGGLRDLAGRDASCHPTIPPRSRRRSIARSLAAAAAAEISPRTVAHLDWPLVAARLLDHASAPAEMPRSDA